MINVITSFWELLKGLLYKIVIVALIALLGIRKYLKNKNITEKRQKYLIGLKTDVARFLSLLTNYDNNDKTEKEIEELYSCITSNLNKKDKYIDTELVQLLDKFKEVLDEFKEDEFKEDKFKEDEFKEVLDKFKEVLDEFKEDEFKEDEFKEVLDKFKEVLDEFKEDEINLLEKKLSMMFEFEWERIETETNFWTFVPVLGWIINRIIIIFKRKKLIKMYKEDNDSRDKKTWTVTTMDEIIFKEIDSKIEIGNTIKSVDDIKKFLSEDRSLTNNDLKRLKKILKFKSEEEILDAGSIILDLFTMLPSLATVFISMISLLNIQELIKLISDEKKEEKKFLLNNLVEYTLEIINWSTDFIEIFVFISLAILVIIVISVLYREKDNKVKNKYKLAIIAIDELLEGQDIDK